MMPIWIIIFVIVGSFLVTRFVRRSVKESIIIDRNGIVFVDRYSGPFSSLLEVNSLKALNRSKLQLSGPPILFKWDDIETVMFGKWWRWWQFFASRGYWGPVMYIIIKTKNSQFFLKQTSPPFPFSYKDKIIGNIKQLGKGNLISTEVYKF